MLFWQYLLKMFDNQMGFSIELDETFFIHKYLLKLVLYKVNKIRFQKVVARLKLSSEGRNPVIIAFRLLAQSV